jgi:hypothetical protein
LYKRLQRAGAQSPGRGERDAERRFRQRVRPSGRKDPGGDRNPRQEADVEFCGVSREPATSSDLGSSLSCGSVVMARVREDEPCMEEVTMVSGVVVVAAVGVADVIPRVVVATAMAMLERRLSSDVGSTRAKRTCFPGRTQGDERRYRQADSASPDKPVKASFHHHP